MSTGFGTIGSGWAVDPLRQPAAVLVRTGCAASLLFLPYYLTLYGLRCSPPLRFGRIATVAAEREPGGAKLRQEAGRGWCRVVSSRAPEYGAAVAAFGGLSRLFGALKTYLPEFFFRGGSMCMVAASIVGLTAGPRSRSCPPTAQA